MRIPKKLKVGGQIYKVKRVKEVNQDVSVLGTCNQEYGNILVCDAYSNSSTEMTFLHELLHAIFTHCNLPQDEDLIERLAQALYMVIVDNPEMFIES